MRGGQAARSSIPSAAPGGPAVSRTSAAAATRPAGGGARAPRHAVAQRGTAKQSPDDGVGRDGRERNDPESPLSAVVMRPGSTKAARNEVRQLRQLARRLGVQDIYMDGRGQRRVAAPEALLCVVRALGVPIQSPSDAARHLHHDQARRSARLCEPVIVSWIGSDTIMPLRLAGSGALEVTIEHARGETRSFRLTTDSESIDSVDDEHHDGRAVAWRGLPRDLDAGRYRLHARMTGREDQATLLVAPARCGTTTRSDTELGVFLPLHAARSSDDWGLGDLGDLRTMIEWAGDAGCGAFGTLPLLACFLDEPVEPSPYSPVSRQVFGEHILDLDPLLAGAPEDLRREVHTPARRAAWSRLHDARQVDYAGSWSLKRHALAALARSARVTDGMREAIERFAADHPVIRAYARFRGALRRLGEHPGDTSAQPERPGWRQWPAAARDGRLSDRDVDAEEEWLFLYAQWRLHQQLRGVREVEKASGCSLYLDLPIGAHRDGFDAWRHPSLFARDVSLGAPPDAFFAEGQSWGLPPLVPGASRAEGHEHVEASIAAHLSIASMLRIDHVAGLHRSFWVPDGMSAQEGVYVTQPSDELYAVLSILSREHGATIVGENLGTVPREVNRAMRRRGVLGMRIAQFELGDERNPLPRLERDSLAALNTHDMPTFRAYWTGHDIDLFESLGLLDDAEGERQARERRRAAVRKALAIDAAEGDDTIPVMLAVLGHLASQRERVLLLNLEDLWGEMEPQNVPGVAYAKAWRRRAARTIEEIIDDDGIRRILHALLVSRGAAGRVVVHATSSRDVISNRRAKQCDPGAHPTSRGSAGLEP